MAALRADAGDGTLAALCTRRGVELLVLFGSAVSHPESAGDVDLVYQVRGGGTIDHLDLVNALGVRYPGDHIDLMALDRADPVAAPAAMTGGEVLVEAASDVFAERQILSVAQFRDTRHLRELAMEVLRG